MNDPISLRPWVRITFFGWLHGIVFVIAFALLSEAVGIRAAQFPVGLGMGLGVGIAQERALRSLLGVSHSWRWTSALGLALPFFIVDLSRLLGVPMPYSLYICVAIAGVTAGACQAYVLRLHRVRAPLWILTSGLGWAAGALTTAVANSLGNVPGLRGLTGALLYLTLVALGGVLLGLATSIPLPQLRGRETEPAASPPA